MKTADKIEDPVTEARNIAEYAIEELGAALVNKLFGTLATINGPLSEERDAKEAEALELRAKYRELQTRVAAQARILDGEIDKAVAEGRDDEAASKRQERAGLEGNLGNILAQAEAREERARAIEDEMRASYVRTFQEVYPAIRSACVRASIAIDQTLTATWGALLRFETESGLAHPFIRPQHRVDLTPDEHGAEAAHFRSLRFWFGGRQ